ncbi:putative tyrosine carboxypeptidase MATCAP2 [Tachysurus vachellii]|uniref:putative tyrosine carboxypeptidase MATCAP2 n=1 Tax=Tachysurus vachellii TaxID=175792 RepID=UPI00296AD7D7|nr:putative tyrosine carboxypeptidase MATCAP2 [Tachysurus vachellii]
MLEAIQVTEHLHWAEKDMAKKCVLRVMEKPVSQVYVGCWSSSVLKNPFSSSFVFPQKEEETEGKRLTHSPYRQFIRAQHIVSSSSHRDAMPLVLIGSGNQSYGEISQSQLFRCSLPGNNISITGSPVCLSPRPSSELSRASQSRVRLPQLAKGSKDGENSTKKLCILAAIKPSNVESEKVKFFNSDFRYNPQFEYSNPASPQVLEKHSKASDRFLTQAVRIMEVALHKYGSYEKFEQATGGSLLTKSRIWAHVKKYMEKEGCVGEIVVHLTNDLLSKASMTVVNRRPTLTINISMAREQWLEGMLRHEIGTHYFRSINNSQQPWSRGEARKKLGLKPINPTEEGLASIHSVLFRRDPRLWRAALLYYTVHQAAHMSFTQLFHELGHFVHDPGTRWDYCVRAKRGQTDTSQPGCFNKDQVYLDGILKLLRHREKIDFQLLTALGKVSYEDVERLKSLAVMENVRIPHFLQDQECYTEQLQKIMAVNQLTDEELQGLI